MINSQRFPIVFSCIVVAGCASGRNAQTAAIVNPGLPLGDATIAAPATQPLTQSPSSEQGRRATPWEVTLGGGGTNDEHFDVGNGNLNVGVGYYFNEVFELVVRQSMSYSDDERPGGGDDDDVWDFQTRVALDAHLPLGRFVPYIGANLGYLYGDTRVTNDTLAAGPEAGVKIYLQPDAFLHIGIEYEFFFDTQTNLDDAFETGQVFYSAGFGLRF